MTNKKMMLVPAALILALFASAFTYGLWFQTLTVDGQVETGDLEWIIVNQFTSDAGQQPDQTILPNGSVVPVPEGKDVGFSYCELARDGKSVHFFLNNTYPGYMAMCQMYFRNTGTIPIHFECIEFLDGQGNLIYNYTYYSPVDAPVMYLDLDGDCNADIMLWFRDNLGEQIHPGGDSDEYSFWIQVLQTASEGAQYDFEMRPTAVQWNESDWPVQMTGAN